MKNKKYWAIGLLVIAIITYFHFWGIVLEVLFRFLGISILFSPIIQRDELIGIIFIVLAFILAVMASDTSQIHNTTNYNKSYTTRSYNSSGSSSSSTSSPKFNNYGLKPENRNNDVSSKINESTESKEHSTFYNEFHKGLNKENTEPPKIDTPKIDISSIPSVPIYNPEHYIGLYHTGYAAYVLVDSVKPMKCTVKATGEGNTYYIYYDFSFTNGEWHFHNSQGFDGLVTNDTPIEQNIINFCKSIDWKPVKTQNINSLYGDDTSDDFQAAKNKLQEFHIDITNKLYRQAYHCLSEEFQKKMPFDGWIKGFNTTVSSTPYNISVDPESNNERVILNYELKAVDNPGGTTYYNGTATLINTLRGWRIDRIKNKLQ